MAKRKFAEGRYYKDDKRNDVVLDPIVNEVFRKLKTRIKAEGRVCIERFGCFCVVNYKGRKFQNHNGKVSVVPASQRISFRASASLKKYLNESKAK